MARRTRARRIALVLALILFLGACDNGVLTVPRARYLFGAGRAPRDATTHLDTPPWPDTIPEPDTRPGPDAPPEDAVVPPEDTVEAPEPKILNSHHSG